MLRRERQHWIYPFYVTGRWVVVALGVGILGFLASRIIPAADSGGFIDGILGLLNALAGWVTLVALAIVLGGLVWSVVQWRTQEYVLTDHRVLHVHGVLNKQSFDSSLENITDAQIDIPLIGRMLGFGDLKFMTASDAGIEDLRTVQDPIAFKKALIEAKAARMMGLGSARTVAAMSAAAPSADIVRPDQAPVLATQAEDIPAKLIALATLRDSEAITAEEYDTKRKELLDRL